MKELTPEQIKTLHALPVIEAIKYWDACEEEGRKRGNLPQVVRVLVLADLYYLLVRVCKRVDMLPRAEGNGFVANQFAFERVREVEANPDGYVDLWAREHFKSSVITQGLTIQDILKDPDVTFGIFSHTRPIAKAFLQQIMRELEDNQTLHAAFPDILCANVKDYPRWNADDGIIVKRKENPKEATIEAWGLVDGQPTSKHFKKLLYDDVVVKDSVSNPEMIQKTLTALEQSYNLGVTPGGVRRMAGTRWNYGDAYRTVIDRKSFKQREHPGRIGGTEDGESIYWSDEIHRDKRRDMGPYTYAAQILMNPAADSTQNFQREWLRFYTKIQSWERMNRYILVDSANSKKKESDYTAMWVIGLGLDGMYYALDMVRDRLNLKERADRLFEWHRKYKPIQVRYETYGMMADVQHIKDRQETENYRFEITEVGGRTSKDDRIKRMIPIFENGRFYLPTTLYISDWQKQPVDLVRSFTEEEYLPFPHGLHKDLQDSLARIAEPDLPLVWPMKSEPIYNEQSIMPSFPSYAV